MKQKSVKNAAKVSIDKTSNTTNGLNNESRYSE